MEAFRKEFFTLEQIDRLQKAEAEFAAEDENLKRYRADEKKFWSPWKCPGTSAIGRFKHCRIGISDWKRMPFAAEKRLKKVLNKNRFDAAC